MADSVLVHVDVPADCSVQWSRIFPDGEISERAFNLLLTVLGEHGASLIDVRRGSVGLLLTFNSYPLLTAFLESLDNGQLLIALSFALFLLGVLEIGVIVRITVKDRQHLEDTLRSQGTSQSACTVHAIVFNIELHCCRK